MDEEKIHENLNLRKVDMKYLGQFNELLRYVFQVTNQDLEDVGYDDGEIIKAKRPILERADVIGWFDEENDTLVSQIAIYPCEVNIHGSIFKMGGLTGVGTYPEYANMGLMSDLIEIALKQMRENKQWISYLYPYSIPYYRRKGWEIISDQISYVLKDTQLPNYREVNGYVERHDVDHEDVLKIYDKYSRINNGALIRGQIEWEEYWRWENEEERTAGVYYDENDNPLGFVFYWIVEDIFHIKEMVYLNQEARYGLWNFISAHFSMVDEVKGHIFRNEPLAFLLDDGQIEEIIEPYYMARIVDVEEFLKVYPFETGGEPFHFIIEDPRGKWNNGIFGISWDKDDKTIVTREAIGKPVKTDIQNLTSMLMSYRSPSYFKDIERIEADNGTVKNLEQIIPVQQPYFSDYF